MDKKKFYIILLSVVIFFTLGYLVIYFSGSFNNDYKTDPIENDVDDIIVDKDSFHLVSVSGKVISVSDNIVKIEANIKGEKKIIEISSKNEIEEIQGSYKEGKLIETKREKVDYSAIEEGASVSGILSSIISSSELEKSVLEVEKIIINPPGDTGE